jgi:hypothetical protein
MVPNMICTWPAIRSVNAGALPDRARENVVAAAGRERHDQPQRFAGVSLRAGVAGQHARASERNEGREGKTMNAHCVPLSC